MHWRNISFALSHQYVKSSWMINHYWFKSIRCWIGNNTNCDHWWPSAWTHRCVTWWNKINSLAPGRFQQNLRKTIFKLILVIDGCDISSEIALRWTSLDLSDDKSILVQVMAWCHQATSHYLNQCWPRSLPPYGVTRPQWVKSLVSCCCHMQTSESMITNQNSDLAKEHTMLKSK